MSSRVRHKVFLSYHHDDQYELNKFIRKFDHERDVFIARAVGSHETTDRLIDSNKPDYVMRRIRQDVLSDSTVTVVFIGPKTWTRKYIDWELAASLRRGPAARKPNGLLAILSPKLTAAILPDRLKDNLETGYAQFYPYPNNREQLFRWIEAAFRSREDPETHQQIKNGRRKLKRNLNNHNDRASRKPESPGQGTNQAREERQTFTLYIDPKNVRPAKPPYLSTTRRSPKRFAKPTGKYRRRRTSPPIGKG